MQKNDNIIIKLSKFKALELSSKNNILVLLSQEDINPMDYIENIYNDIIKYYKVIEYIYIDMSKFYGKYGEWLWKCKFIKNNINELIDIECDSVSSIELSKMDDNRLIEYIKDSK